MVHPPREFIFGDDRPFASCHASTLLPLGRGEILAAWFGGTREGHPDVAIWLSRRMPSGPRGGEWTSPVAVAAERDLPHWNPVLCRSPGGVVHLFYKTGPEVPRWKSRVMTSSDGGYSWSTPRELDALRGFPPGPVKNKAIVLADGSWVAPTSRETQSAWDAGVTWSRDEGASWSVAAVPLEHGGFPGRGVIQPTLWESRPSQLHMLLRSTAGCIYRSDSADGGASWGAAYATEIPNNNSGIDLDRLPDGRLALCSNPVGVDWGKRTPLVLSLSSDEGSRWRLAVTLEDEEDERRSPEFSYPAVVCHEGVLHLCYTWKRERICYRRVDLQELD